MLISIALIKGYDYVIF